MSRPIAPHCLAWLQLLCALACVESAHALEAFGAPGAAATRGPAAKSFLGTALSDNARVYFTGYRGILSEVYYPSLDSPQTVDLQFLVGDRARTFVDEEKRQNYSARQSGPRTLSWQVDTHNLGHNWRLAKRIFTDPARNALIERITFTALNGHRVSDFNLYLLFKPALGNSGNDNRAATVNGPQGPALTASHGQRASAIAVSLPWKVSAGRSMTSNGFVGSSDGWTDLLGGKADFRMDWNFSSAAGGNVAQMGWLDTSARDAASLSFDLVLGFGDSQQSAIDTAFTTLNSDLDLAQTHYDDAWTRYSAGLSDQGGSADAGYYLAAMTLKTTQDKITGAMVAGMSTPWGESQGEGNPGGYHLVWPRDLFKFANALYTAGDHDSAGKVARYLFNTLQQKTDCGQAEYQATGCRAGYSRRGRFPQNAWTNGWPYWQGTQMDEQAMPIILAWRLGPEIFNPLWPQIKLSADYLAATGPRTMQERWEETAGYSPSTIAAEIAGLVTAADIARQNGDPASAARYLARADHWQQNVTAWTYTTTGSLGNGQYYIRINPSESSAQSDRAPVNGPNSAQTLSVNNGGGQHDSRRVVDSGFSELVRMGVKRALDPSISQTLSVFDSVLGQSLPTPGAPPLPLNAWFRYNFDGYGEHNDGHDFDGTGRGRLWPIFTAERGMLEIARQGRGSAGAPYLAALKHFTTAEGFLPEQIWPRTTTLPDGWQVTTPDAFTPGQPTQSIAPLNWAMGEYISLLASIHAGRVIDIPSVVCARYNNCQAPLKNGEVATNVSTRAATQYGEQVYITGNTAALGNWNNDLGIPLEATDYPVWRNQINLPASQTIAYRYYRKNRDGSVTWEAFPGNRELRTPISGPVRLDDQVSWS